MRIVDELRIVRRHECNEWMMRIAPDFSLMIVPIQLGDMKVADETARCGLKFDNLAGGLSSGFIAARLELLCIYGASAGPRRPKTQ